MINSSAVKETAVRRLVMNNAELYQKNNTLQKRDALCCLQEYGKKIKWKNYDVVIDIGCGDGGVTTDVLKRFIPTNYKKLIGVDISEKMVQFANEHHGDHRTGFRVMDIENKLPKELMGTFDHAFSFYTLHWIRNQERALSNIYDLLSEGGDCLLIFLGHMPVFDVFRILSRYTKWNPWLKDVDHFISPYHDSQDPEKEVRRTMSKIGFREIDVQCKQMMCTYNTEDCKKAVAAVNPFKIPEVLEEEFLEDYLDIVIDMRFMDKVTNLNEPHITAGYTLIVAYGRK